MEQNSGERIVVRFGAFEVDLRTGELRRKGLAVNLQEQPFRILALLLERPGELVTREELRQKLWPDDVIVEFDQGLNNAIKKLRYALDDSAETPRFVETLPRRGYRFVAPVERVGQHLAGIETAPAGRKATGRFFRMGSVLAAVVAVGFAAILARRTSAPVPPADRNVMLAVLPFENLSGDPHQEYFSDGMTEEMIAQIGRLHAGRLRVIGRASAMKFRDGDQDDISRIARELAVGYVLRGSIRRSGERVRVTAELVRVQIDVARAIAREVPIAGSVASEPVESAAARRSVNPEAYEAYLKGLYFWNKFAAPMTWKALEQFQRSIALDPGYAPAHAGLSSAYGILTVFEAIPPREGQPKAGAEARRALELDETLPTAHVQLGFYQLNYLWDFAGALKSFERAVDLDPSSSAALHGLATALVVHGRFDEALARMKHATEVDPLWLLASADLCTFLYFERRYDAAIAQCRKTLEMEPDFPPALYYLSEIYETLGRDDDVYRSYRKLLPLMGVSSENMARNEAAYAAGGWKAVAKMWLEVQLAERKKRPLPSFSIAESYRRLGETEAALDWLEKACDERHFEVVFLKVSPKFDSLRSHPRFERLLKRMGLAT